MKPTVDIHNRLKFSTNYFESLAAQACKLRPPSGEDEHPISLVSTTAKPE